MVKRILTLLPLLMAFFWSVGQETLQPRLPDAETKGVIYNKETVFDLFIHTRGFGFGMKFGQMPVYYKTKYYSIDFSTQRAPKEFKPNNQGNYLNFLNKPYVYGKQNSFYTLRFGLGEKRYYSEKARKRGIAIAMNYQGGLSLGLLKPYYLDLRQETGGTGALVESEKYSEENAHRFLDKNYIVGYSGFGKGLGETQIVPGIHFKTAVHFAWGAYEKSVKALEVGLMIDVYIKTIDIMVDNSNKPYFINLYLNLQLGKRK